MAGGETSRQPNDVIVYYYVGRNLLPLFVRPLTLSGSVCVYNRVVGRLVVLQQRMSHPCTCDLDGTSCP